MNRTPLAAICILIVVALLTAPRAAGAAKRKPGHASPSTDVALAVCYSSQNLINSLADFTHTRCWPALKEGYGFVVVSEKPVFAAEAAKKAWLLTVVAAIGKELNDRQLSGTELLLSDVAHTKDGVAWSLPVSVARSLQKQIKADQITLDTMYTGILRNLKKVSMKEPTH